MEKRVHFFHFQRKMGTFFHFQGTNFFHSALIPMHEMPKTGLAQNANMIKQRTKFLQP